ncbi:aminotransferase class I/II-fold pyridoxal phosphate-dependent enzyme [Microbacterium azadirachtae]|uniref:Aminotransferase n=1 Tax=Microbacterium azadirachtae TaxID=582680 RepID=A0A1I6G641_9MICO|nr:aminotransferase class I/II-fold pyridoxal phosphate-dependent enzyme [Microbacterium azadirachtae]SDL35183.1 Aspartate/methionine/tyrosine aminotransferase [Microbacterium azadirachtae]SEF65853.1 Aspartate/methionine/tyrosine aminotransferase [Microbacterium azadirachtae]SEF66652.1 Aspartate/methionine/tyrosine aminotransferase [Microbacterium azadirachtae]SFR37601.1 Aspartate/methionine/tyrosine aminotransferase [Microbacterium azadirachtae]
MVTISPTSALRARAAELRAAGRNVLDLSLGELDFATPTHIVEAAVAAATRIESHHYGPTGGDSALRDAIADRVSARLAHPAAAENVAVTNGAKQALYNTFRALLQPGDEVLIPAPYWVTFPSSVELAQGVPVIVAPHAGSFKPTVEELEGARTDSTRVLLLCSPHNPTGAVFDAAELRAILEWALEHGIWVVADETYVELAYADVPAPAQLREQIQSRLVTVSSVSKSFAMTGWRVGWMAGPSEVVERGIAVQSHTTSSVNRVAQAAAIAALAGPDVTAGFRNALQRRLEVCREALEPLGMFSSPPDGGFYVFADVSRYGTDVAVAARLLEAGVVVVPGSSFGAPGHIRISYAISDDQLRHGLDQISDVFASHPSPYGAALAREAHPSNTED